MQIKCGECGTIDDCARYCAECVAKLLDEAYKKGFNESIEKAALRPKKFIDSKTDAQLDEYSWESFVKAITRSIRYLRRTDEKGQ